MERWLFVCTGNLCRSPLAAVLADRVALEKDREAEIRSAGTHARPGDPAHAKVVAAAREIGLDLSGHRAARLDEAAVRWATRVFVMEEDHARAARELVPDLPESAVVPLGPFVGKPAIEDPIGSWFLSSYRKTRDELHEALRRAL